MRLNAPEEHDLAHDFINIILDDEYGLMPLSASNIGTILDVGANIGLFSLWARANFTSATIHSYEPNPRLIPFTKTNLNQIGATLFHEGIGADNGFATLDDHSESRLAKVLYGSKSGIPITSLRLAIAKLGGSVDLLKLDCEGAEWDIFRDETAFRNVRFVRMEYHVTTAHTLDDLTSFAIRTGFKIKQITANDGFGIAWLEHQ